MTNRRGEPCKASPLKDGDRCAIHAGVTVPPDFSDSEVQRRHRAKPDVRGRFAADAAEDYELMREKLREALVAETVRWGSCPGCGKRVGVEFPDFNARVKAMSLWLDQGFGRPRETVAVELDVEDPLDVERMTPDEREALKRALLRQHPHLAEAYGDVARELRNGNRDDEELARLLNRRPGSVRRGD
jgi:hypothetical protein